MLDLEYTLAICSFLFIFVLLVYGGQTSGAVARCIGVKYTYIKESILASVPIASCMYIELCPIIRIGRSQPKGFTGQWLQMWFDGHIRGNIREQGSC